MSVESDYKVADIKLADFGRKEIELAEVEMPGLMAARTEYGPAQTLKGALRASLSFSSTLIHPSPLVLHSSHPLAFVPYTLIHLFHSYPRP